VIGVGRAGSLHGDTVLLTLGATLISIGVIAIASASIEYGDFHFGNPWHHTQRHAAYLILAITLGALAYMAPAATVQRLSPWLLFLAVALLILVMIPGIGREVNGAQRWLPLGGHNASAIGIRQAGSVALRRRATWSDRKRRFGIIGAGWQS
jgi:cell division protein FtsW (lipid II flippase)